MGKVNRKHDDLHIGLIVFMTALISVAALLMAQYSAQFAQTFWLVAMFIMAFAVAVWDVGD